MSPPAESYPICKEKNYTAILGERNGALKAKPKKDEPAMADEDFVEESPTATVATPDGDDSHQKTASGEDEGAVEGTGTADPDREDQQKQLDKLAALYEMASQGLPPEVLAASGGADAWKPDQRRIDRKGDKIAMHGMLKGGA